MLTFKGFISEMYVKLSGEQLLKPGREGRAENIVRKINDGDPFLTMKGDTVILRKDNSLETYRTAVRDGNKKAMNAIEFTGVNGKKYQLADLAKSPEFGGKGKGSGTRAEDEALADLKKKLQAVYDKETVPFILVKIGKRTERVAAIESTPGVPKSDFHMLDPEGKEVFWISHKKGNKANDFQQYGGMPELKNTKSKDMFSFVDAVVKELNGAKRFPMKTAYARKVTDPKIIRMTMYGKGFKSKPDGRQNIDVLYQGPMNLKRSGVKDGIPIYTITSNHTQYHNELPKTITSVIIM